MSSTGSVRTIERVAAEAIHAARERDERALQDARE
jgi:hypothetical protein